MLWALQPQAPPQARHRWPSTSLNIRRASDSKKNRREAVPAGLVRNISETEAPRQKWQFRARHRGTGCRSIAMSPQMLKSVSAAGMQRPPGGWRRPGRGRGGATGPAPIAWDPTTYDQAESRRLVVANVYLNGSSSCVLQVVKGTARPQFRYPRERR
jgi:hypothetical protein